MCKWNKEIQCSGYPLAIPAVSALVYTSSPSRAKHVFSKLKNEAILKAFFNARSHVIGDLQRKR